MPFFGPDPRFVVFKLMAFVPAAILSGNTGVSKALLAIEREIAQGKLRFLFTVRILFPRTLSVNDYIIVRFLRRIIRKINGIFRACACSSPQAFPPSLERPGIRPESIILLILPIMLLSNSQKTPYYAFYICQLFSYYAHYFAIILKNQ